MVLTCVCKKTLREGDRRIDATLVVEWSDEREAWSGTKTFCSFSCLAAWASEKSVQHDDRAVISPPESFEPAEPVVDTQTERLVR